MAMGTNAWHTTSVGAAWSQELRDHGSKSSPSPEYVVQRVQLAVSRLERPLEHLGAALEPPLPHLVTRPLPRRASVELQRRQSRGGLGPRGAAQRAWWRGKWALNGRETHQISPEIARRLINVFQRENGLRVDMGACKSSSEQPEWWKASQKVTYTRQNRRGC